MLCSPVRLYASKNEREIRDGEEGKEKDVSGGDGGKVRSQKCDRIAASNAPIKIKERKLTGKAQEDPQRLSHPRRIELPITPGFFPFWELNF